MMQSPYPRTDDDLAVAWEQPCDGNQSFQSSGMDQRWGTLFAPSSVGNAFGWTTWQATCSLLEDNSMRQSKNAVASHTLCCFVFGRISMNC
jgi:hypothetical protein